MYNSLKIKEINKKKIEKKVSYLYFQILKKLSMVSQRISHCYQEEPPPTQKNLPMMPALILNSNLELRSNMTLP